MTAAEILTEIRRLIREPSPVTVSNADINAVVLRAVTAFGLLIREAAPSYHQRKAVLFSLSNVFDLPSDCLTIRNVWDAGGHAMAITGASNESDIEITSPVHTVIDGNIVLVSGVQGNTGANGIWYAIYVDADKFKLAGAVGNGEFLSTQTGYIYDSSGDLIVDGSDLPITYSHGGNLIVLRQDLTKILRKVSGKANHSDRYCWYPQGGKLVVDYLDMSHDVIVEYNYRPSAVTDIPEDFHDGLIAYSVLRLMRMPEPKDPTYADKRKILDEQASLLAEMKDTVRSVMQPASEAEPIEDVMEWDSLWEW